LLLLVVSTLEWRYDFTSGRGPYLYKVRGYYYFLVGVLGGS